MSFYNAGGGIDKIDELRFFLDKIPLKTQPQVLLICLDQNFFNSKFDNLSDTQFEKKYQDNYSLLSYVFGNAFLIWKDLFNGKIKSLDSLYNASIGLNAGFYRNGFAFDGSYHYGERIYHPTSTSDYQFKDSYERIKKGIRRFEYGTTVNMNAVKSLDDFLSACYRRRIKVYAFLPPYANSVIKKMRMLKGGYIYIDKISGAVEPFFKKYSFSLFDFTDVSWLGLKDENFIDGLHGSEKVYLKMVQEMCKRDSGLRRYFDEDYLNVLYTNSKNDLEVL